MPYRGRWAKCRGGCPDRRVRPGADGLSDAGHGRLRSRPPDSRLRARARRPRGLRRPPADRRTDGQRRQRRPRALPGGRDGRLSDQAHRARDACGTRGIDDRSGASIGRNGRRLRDPRCRLPGRVCDRRRWSRRALPGRRGLDPQAAGKVHRSRGGGTGRPRPASGSRQYRGGRATAHQLRGMAANLGVAAVAELAGQLEALAQRSELEQAAAPLVRLHEAFARARQFMPEVLDELRAGPPQPVDNAAR